MHGAKEIESRFCCKACTFLCRGPKQSKNLTQTFIKKDGNPTSSPIETLQRLKEYYSELLNRQPSIHTEKVDMYIQKFQRPICWKLDNESTMDELRKIFFSMKNHKTTSVDMIPVEIHKYAESKILKTKNLQTSSGMLEYISSSGSPF